MDESPTMGKKLNNLLEKIYSTENGFDKASKRAVSAALKNFFLEKASERCRFGHQLKTEMMKFNQQILMNVGSAGTLHEGWTDVMAFFSSNNDESMFEEAIMAEKAVLDEYRGVLEEIGLLPSTELLIRRQMNKISHDLTIIRRLEDIEQK